MGDLVNIEWFSKYQYLIGCRIAFSDNWHDNCQSGNTKTETWFNLCFKQKLFLACLFLSWFCIKDQIQFMFVCSFLAWN